MENIKKEIERFLDHRSIISLATVSPAGKPMTHPVAYASEGATLYVATYRSSRKVENILKNPSVAYDTFIYPGDWKKTKSIQMEGRAFVVRDKDEKEKGERKKLNFGHTFGHALEKTLAIPHGEAVSLGMVVAARLSQKLGGFPAPNVERLIQLLEKFDLPVKIDAGKSHIKDALRKDKKRYGDSIKFVLLEKIGRCVIKDVSLLDLEAVVDELY